MQHARVTTHDDVEHELAHVQVARPVDVAVVEHVQDLPLVQLLRRVPDEALQLKTMVLFS